MKSLSVFNIGPLWYWEDSYWTNVSLYYFFEELSTKYRTLYAYSPVKYGCPPASARKLYEDKLIIVALPWYYSIVESSLSFIKYLLSRDKIEIHGDCFLLMDYVNPYFWYFYLLAKKEQKKIIVYLRAEEMANQIPSHGIHVKKLLLNVVGKLLFHKIKHISYNVPILVAGDKLKTYFDESSSFVRVVSPSIVRKVKINRSNNKIQDKIKMLWVGRISHEKGVDVILKALKHADLSCKNASLYIVGAEGNNHGYLKMLYNLRENITSINVNFTGEMTYSDVLNMFRSSDIFLLSSLSEGRPKVLYEAMANGLAIISTNVGGIPDILNNNESALLVSSGDVLAYKNALESICNDPELRKRLAATAYGESDKYTIQSSTDDFYMAIEESCKFWF